MIKLKEEVKEASGSLPIHALSQGQAFIKVGCDIELKNVYIALFHYSEHDNDVVCMPLSSSGDMFRDMEEFRSDFYLSKDTPVIPVTLGVDSVTRNTINLTD